MPQIDLCGDDTLSVAIDVSSQRHSIADHLRDTGSWLECIEGMQSVVIRFDSASLSIDGAKQQLCEQLDSVLKDVADFESTLIEIPVCYGGEYGPDLESVCQMLTLTADELIEIHTDAEYRIEMLGFTPGFAYVGGLSAELNVPRLAEPRQRVAAGSIGITDGLTGLYALPGPGGWPLVGRTPMSLFEVGSDQPFLLRAGMRVQFTAIDEKVYRRMVAT
ncbi:MAG: 5-oxoprolinase subunit PxpB [Proteobacteria bacterium]|nr:5-oxoprolinase subunit PxpB [Pseudomonadota bacterium]